MKDITKADKNFIVAPIAEKDGIYFYDAESEPFSIFGIFREGDRFRRLSDDVARQTNEGVYQLHTNTAGGRVRFATNSKCVAIKAEMGAVPKFSHMPRTGVAGFDMYSKVRGKERYCGTFVPPFELSDDGEYESIIHFNNRNMREITINFPLYSDVKKLYIGLEKDANISKSAPYENEKPIVYYGSSITQGGCASRPGNSYQAIISRHFNRDYINLGFSGSARAEKAIYDHIKKLDMEIFVYDYDHNAPSPEYLSETHEKMFLEIRKAQPNLPIIIMSAPSLDWDKKRIAIIKKTYDNAVSAGDKNIYFLDGKTLMKNTANDGTVDMCHPNDFGFRAMSKAVISVISDILEN